MAHLRKRRTKKGAVRWIAEIRRKGARSVAKSFGSKEAAQVWSRRVERELDRGAAGAVLEGERHSVADAIERYRAEHLGNLAASDRRTRAQQLRFWEAELGPVVLARVTPAAISEARRRLLHGRRDGSGRLVRVSGPTANRYLAALSRVFSLAVGEWLWLEENPVRRVSRSREKAGRVRYLSDAERQVLLEKCRESGEGRLYPLVLLALATGARQGELLGLRWSSVDLVAGRAVLDRTKNRDRRSLYVSGEALAVLRELARTPHISGFVFASRRGFVSFPRKAWAQALREAGIEDFRFHDLRHTAASYLAMSGGTLSEIAAFLGHRSLAMVARYAHIAESHSEAVAARMVERFLP